MLGPLGVGPLNSYHASTNYFWTQALIVFKKHPPHNISMDLHPWVSLAKFEDKSFSGPKWSGPVLQILPLNTE